MFKELATIEGKKTSEYLLEFENKVGTQSGELQEYIEVIDIARKHLQYYEQALTPPTAEEVCEALSKYYDREVFYSNDNRDGFHFHNSFYIVMFRDGEIHFTDSLYFQVHHLPSYLITLIGRFYDGLEEENNNKQQKRDKLLELHQKREANRNLPHPSQADELTYTREIKALESELNDQKRKFI